MKQMNQTMMRRLISIGMLLVLIVLFTILAGAGKGKFLSFDNLIEIVRDASIPAIVGVGVTFVIITAGIDLSTGSAMALVGMVMANIYAYALLPFPVMIAAGILTGVICGFVNGYIVAKLHVPEFIGTLATMSIYRALTYIIAIKDANGVGRVELELTKGEAEYLRGKDAYTASWATPRLKGAGTYMLSPHAAVIYMRCRKSASAINGEKYDYRRTTRARNVLVTDMSAMDLLEAADIAFDLKTSDIDQFRVPIDGTHKTISYSSGSCEEIDFLANREALWEYLGYNSFVVREEE